MRMECEFDEGEIVGGEFVVSGRHRAEMFELVEEPFDRDCGSDSRWG